MKSILDLKLGLKLAHQKPELHREILHCLRGSLFNDIEQIEIALRNKNMIKAKAANHRLQSAVCYCGTPRLLDAIIALEEALNKKTDPIFSLTTLKDEAMLVIQAIEQIYN